MRKQHKSYHRIALIINTYRTPPISSRLIMSGFQSDARIGFYCKDCDTTQPANFDFANTTFAGWDKIWPGFALKQFDASFELVIDLSAGADHNLTLLLLKETVEADGVVVRMDFQLYLVASTRKEMSFTAGLDLSVSSHFSVLML